MISEFILVLSGVAVVGAFATLHIGKGLQLESFLGTIHLSVVVALICLAAWVVFGGEYPRLAFFLVVYFGGGWSVALFMRIYYSSRSY